MIFKLGQLSDPHIGYKAKSRTNKYGVNLRVLDGYNALEEAVTQMIEQNIDVCLWPGDIFHSPNPDIRDIIFMQNQLRRLSDAGISSYLLAGNHDALDKVTEIAASRVVHDPYRNIFSEHDPYVKHEIADGIVVHMISHHVFSEQQGTLSKIKAEKDAINILSAHGSIIDPLTQLKLHTEKSPREVIIPDFILNDNPWAYILLGHIHERGFPGSENYSEPPKKGHRIFYNGSLIRRGFADKEAKLGRGWTLWNIQPDGTMTPEFFTVKQRPQKDFAHINALNFTPGEITDMIVDNLSGTPGFGSNFDETNAPILRQIVFNLNSVKHQALDWKTIEKNSSHAFQWSLKAVFDNEVVPDDNEFSEKVSTNLGNSGDIIKNYQEWANNSETMSKVSDDNKDRVLAQGRKFIQSGQDGVLNEQE